MDNQNKKVTIYPLGAGMQILALIFGLMLISCVALVCVTLFGDSEEMFWEYLISGIIGILISISALFTYFFKGKVVFKNNYFTCKQGGTDKRFLQMINKDCRNIISHSNGRWIEFTCANGEKFTFMATNFTKKQVSKILKEIKLRGGLQQ